MMNNSDYQGATIRSKYVSIYFTIFLLTCGIFFIRNDWPLGVDGALISLSSIAVILFFFFFKILRHSYVLRPSLHTKLFACWVLTSCFSAVISFWYSQQLSVSIFLVREIVIVLAFFSVGYILVRYYAISPTTVFYASFVWLFIAAFAVLEVYFTSDNIRRINVLGSVNYMASSFAAYFVYCVATIVGKKTDRFEKMVLLIGGIVAFFGLILSGSRSSYLAVALVVIMFILWFISHIIRTGRLRSGIFKNRSFLLVVATVGSVLFYLSQDKALSSLFSRMDMNFVVDSAEQRIFGNYLAAVDVFAQSDNLLQFFFGTPYAYPLYHDSINPVHPHNLFLSSLLFTGVWSFISLSLFLFTLSISSLRLIKGRHLISDKHTVVILVLFLFVIFTYTLFSGHFTRNWHFFFVCGLLSAHIEVAKARLNSCDLKS